MKKVLLLSVGLILCFVSLNAQTTGKDTAKIDYNHWFATLNGGVMQFYGDVSDETYFPGSSKSGKFNWFINPRIGYNFNQYFGAQVSVLTGSLWAENSGKTEYFHANVNDYQLEGIVNLTSVFFPKKYNKKWEAYMLVGGGFMQYRSILKDDKDVLLGYVGYDKNEVKQSMEWAKLWSLGWGVRYKLTNHLDLGVEVDLRKPPVDNLDAKDGKINPFLVYSEYDRYSYTGLQLTYTFGSKANSWQWNPKDPELDMLYDALRRQKDNLDTLNKDIAALKKCKCEIETPEDLKDDDQDGVPNSRDLEPNTARGSLVNFQGVRIPIFDTTGMDFNKMIKGNGGNNLGMYFVSVYFPFDETTIDASNYQKLVMIATYLQQNKDAKIKVVGNCDVRGTNPYNDDLAVRRSKAVVKVLKKDFGIDENRLIIEGLGENKPISPKVHQVNRRVDFFIAN